MKNTNLIASQSEKSLLGSLLVEPSLILKLKKIRPYMFAISQNADIAKIIWDRYEESKNIEIGVIADLSEDEDYVFELIKKTDISNFGVFEELIVDRYIKREVIRINEESIRSLRDGEKLNKTISNAENQKSLLMAIGQTGEESRIDQIKQVLDGIRQSSENDNELAGINTGYGVFNRLCGGWQLTDQIIVAGRPGMGKTTIVLCYFLLAAIHGAKVVFFSLEMDRKQIYHKFISMLTGISVEKIRKGVEDVEMEMIDKAAAYLYELPIFIETAFTDLAAIKSRARYLNEVYDIQLLAVDYIQLLSIKGNRGQSKNDLLEEISREFKLLANENDCNCVNFIISQLNRSVETRGGMKRPMMSDLRSSGALEQDANMVQLIYRAEYYKIYEDEEGNSLHGIAEVDIAKNRNGRLGVVKMKADLQRSVFLEIDSESMTDSNFFTNILFPDNSTPITELSRAVPEDDLPF